MTDGFKCWNCGEPLQSLLMPLSRREECASCGADLHACRFCCHYDPGVSGGCREERAEDVFDKQKANFCDYLQPNSKAYSGESGRSDTAAKAQLAELFGETPADDAGEDNRSDADKAMDELKRLFGDAPKKG